MMKSKLLAILAVSALGFTGCSDDDDPSPIIGGGDVITELNGNITEDAILDGSSIKLTGMTIVRSGATLTIPAGTTITANGGGNSVYLLVERGAKIIADGTADSPIVFTSSVQKSGSWGGLLINGAAPISHATGGANEAATEINVDIKFGGDNVGDDSGILNYVKIEYSGAKIDDEAEHNGLTLNGVGNGTKINNIFIKDGADDGIEFFGGSVNINNLLVSNSEDDMFDFSQGYTGTVTNAYGIWEPSYVSTSSDPRGIEADGNLDGDNPEAENQSAFTIKDMSIVNKSTAAEMNDIVKIRRGAKATITNLAIEVAETAKFSDILDFTDSKGNGVAASSIEYSFNPSELFDASKIKNPDNASITKNETSQGADVSVFGWTSYSF